MTILDVNNLALELVARDYSNGHTASNAGPTKTSRALAIIHLAARDAYAKVTSAYPAKLAAAPSPPAGLATDDATGSAALLGAAIRTTKTLYPDDYAFIDVTLAPLVAAANQKAVLYGGQVGDYWLQARSSDNSNLPQTDHLYSADPGRHRPDPLNPAQQTLGRNWGKVTPFVLNNVALEAPLGPPPVLTDPAYGKAFDEVFVNGRDNIEQRDAKFQTQAAIGLFWGYDGSNKIGTPPRLYNQVVRSTSEFQAMAHAKQINVLAAVNAALADAGIAAWHWKYQYDFWRPVVAIREARPGFGPTGKGDQNTHRTEDGDPFWLPLGAPKSNPFPTPVAGAPGANFTPNFPAYPSGHATFGTAAFETFALLVGKTADQISYEFVSDEFNGLTVDSTGALRPIWSQAGTLKSAIAQNSISRIYLGVHWIFDAAGGEKVGSAVAQKVAAAFA